MRKFLEIAADVMKFGFVFSVVILLLLEAAHRWPPAVASRRAEAARAREDAYATCYEAGYTAGYEACIDNIGGPVHGFNMILDKDGKQMWPRTFEETKQKPAMRLKDVNQVLLTDESEPQ